MEPLVSPSTYGVRPDLADSLVNVKLLISLALVAGVLGVRWAVTRLIRRQSEYLSDHQRRMISRVRNGGLVALILALLALWLPELEAFALSVAAFAVALVIATKEVILCLAGTLVRSASGSFTAGDWIEVAGRSGEVSEQTLMTTTLLEYDADRMEYTGRAVTLPNSVYLSAPVVNHGFRKRFAFHVFTLHTEPMPGALEARDAILAGLEEAAREFEDVAGRYAALIEKRMGVHLPPARPRVRLRTTEFAKFAFEATLFCPRDRALDMEAAATAAFQAWVEAQPWRFAGTSPRAEA